MKRNFISGFSKDLDDMIDLKVSLRYSESTYLDRAHDFDRFCVWKYPDETTLTEPIVLNWLKTHRSNQGNIIHAMVTFARSFGRYQCAVGKEAFVISEKFTTGRSIFVPYLFTDGELENLFQEIDCLTPKRDPLASMVLSTYFRMTYTCGLRPGEGRNIRRTEVDLNSGELRIVDSKRHRSRTVVMSDDMTALARSYAAMRDAARPDSEYFFPTQNGGPYTAAWMQGKFKKAFAASKPDVPKDLLPSVRVYDLRHRFATAILNRWLDEERDLSSRLSYLQAYMGHKQLEATAYYIHLLPENLVKSAGIDWESIGRILPRAELWFE